jgi:hypothetical protein
MISSHNCVAILAFYDATCNVISKPLMAEIEVLFEIG